MIVFISCVKTKLPYEEMAKNLYCSNYFKTCYRYAQFLNPAHIYILSAKYGLLEPEDVICPYEMTLNNFSLEQKKEWAKFDELGGDKWLHQRLKFVKVEK